MTSSFNGDSAVRVVHLPTLEEMQKKRAKPAPLPVARGNAIADAGNPKTGAIEAYNAPLEFFLSQSGASLTQVEEQTLQIVNKAREEVSALRTEADQLLWQAEQDAEQILREAKDQREMIFAKAREEAYTDAVQAAQAEREAFIQKAREEQQSRDEQYALAIARLAQTAEALFAQIQDEQLNIALAIAKKILHMEFDRNDAAYQNIVTHMLRAMSERKPLRLRVSKWEYARFFSGGDTPLRVELAARDIQVIEDALLAPSQCRLETECGNVEAGIDGQLDRLSEALGTQEGRET